MLEDEGIGFNRVPLKLEDLLAAPVKMDDMRAEVQDPLDEINLGTTKHPRLTYVNNLLPREFADCFAWDYNEMPDLDQELIEHRLPMKEEFRPFKQPVKRMAPKVMLKVKKKSGKAIKGWVHSSYKVR